MPSTTDYYSRSKGLERQRLVSSLLGSKILKSEPVERLQGVSFLGALNIAAAIPEPLRFSRFDHSISVAYLSWRYCQNLRLPEDISLMATLFALIHDVGHAPFSHSTEIYLKRRAGFHRGHDQAFTGGKIARVVRDGFSSFPGILQSLGADGLIDNLHRLLVPADRDKYHASLVNMFDTPFCPDTFDGVNRAWYALGTEATKDRLRAFNFKPRDAMDPLALVKFVSSAKRPLTFRSAQRPSVQNPLLKFHELMRILYHEIICAPWQTAAMVMFARALEIAYADIKEFPFSHIQDQRVIRKIDRNTASRKLYARIAAGDYFQCLSIREPSVQERALQIFEKHRHHGTPPGKIMSAVESELAKQLGFEAELLYCYIFNPLIWSAENIAFEEAPVNVANLPVRSWQIKWDASEGKPAREPRLEIYYGGLAR